jgi:hypothetical protein
VILSFQRTKGQISIVKSDPASLRHTPGLIPLLINLALEAGQNELDLVVDSSDDPEIQTLLDNLGFAPAGKDEQFVVVEKNIQ